MSRTTPGEAVSGFTQLEVQKRYIVYLEDHHGDITDLPRLLEVMWNAGGRNAIAAMTEMSDVLPLINRIEGRLVRLRELLETLRDEG